MCCRLLNQGTHLLINGTFYHPSGVILRRVPWSELLTIKHSYMKRIVFILAVSAIGALRKIMDEVKALS